MLAIVGLLIGLSFGFLLQKGQVLYYDNQVNAMLLKSMLIFKFMMSAMITGSIGLFLCWKLHYITIVHEPFNWFGILVGGAIFGIGWGLLGYCPGTAIGAVAQGNIDALFGVIGMIFGSAIYANKIYPIINPLYKNATIGLLQLFGGMLSYDVSLIIFIVLILLIFKLFHILKL